MAILAASCRSRPDQLGKLDVHVALRRRALLNCTPCFGAEKIELQSNLPIIAQGLHLVCGQSTLLVLRRKFAHAVNVFLAELQTEEKPRGFRRQSSPFGMNYSLPNCDFASRGQSRHSDSS